MSSPEMPLDKVHSEPEASGAEEQIAHWLGRAELAGEPGVQVQCLVRAASVCETKLGDSDKALLILETALRSDAGNENLARELARLATARRRWPTLLAHCDALLADLPTASRVALLLTMARWHERDLGDPGAAEAKLAAALELDPGHGGVVRAVEKIAESAWDRGNKIEASRWFEKLMPAFGGRPRSDRAALHRRVAEAAVLARDARKAQVHYRLSHDLEPENLEGLTQWSELAVAQGWWLDVRTTCEAILSHGGSRLAGESRGQILQRLGRACLSLGDSDQALRVFLKGLKIHPTDRRTLQEVLELLTSAKQWKRVVATLEVLSDLETGLPRARCLVAMGNILRDQLKREDEALEAYNRALDEDPDDLKTFERIDRILTAKRAWKDQARSYRRMIKRLTQRGTPVQKPVLLALWRGLAEIYRTRLKDFDVAAAAFEVCASLDPDNRRDQEILTEILERKGSAGLDAAANGRVALASASTSAEEMSRHLRALGDLYTQHRQWDGLFCSSSALVAAGQATPQEQSTWKRQTASRLAIPQASLTEEIWQRAIYHPAEDRRVSQIFAVTAGPIASVRAREARAWGLKAQHRVRGPDVSQVPSLVRYASTVLGVALPPLYLLPKGAGEVEVATVLERGLVVPSLVIRGDVLAGRSEREAAFVIGRALALLRLEHLPLWPQVVSSNAELRIALLALFKMFQPTLRVPEEKEKAFRTYASLFKRTLPPQALEPLLSVIPSLLAQPFVDLTAWATAAEHTANRAGLLVCGDAVAATAVLSSEAKRRGKAASPAISELLDWSLSREHLALRARLGLAVRSEELPADDTYRRAPRRAEART